MRVENDSAKHILSRPGQYFSLFAFFYPYLILMGFNLFPIFEKKT
jgi:hypothetical protein